PDDQRRAADVAEALADRVVGQRVERVDEPGLPRAAHLLADRRARERVGGGTAEPHEHLPRSRAPRDGVGARADEAAPGRDEPLAVLQGAEDALVAVVLAREAR